jgi:hypothetical protein
MLKNALSTHAWNGNGTWRAWNNDISNRLDVVVGLPSVVLSGSVKASGYNGMNDYGPTVALGLNTTTPYALQAYSPSTSATATDLPVMSAEYKVYLASGYNQLILVQYSEPNQTFYSYSILGGLQG